MQSFWQKLWFYTRLVLVSAGAICVLLFIIFNFRATVRPSVDLIFVKYEEPALLLVLISTVALSILGWWLFWTIFRTIRQIRESHNRSKVQRLEREVEDMKIKAARLQTRPTAISSESYDTPTTQSQPPLAE
jgi:hypothetical protein